MPPSPPPADSSSENAPPAFSNGAIFAIPGAVFLAYTLLTALTSVSGMARDLLMATPGSGTVVARGAFSIFIILAVRGAFAVPALVALVYALVACRYRARWFFHFLLYSSFPLLLLFPAGTGFGLYFLYRIYRQRREFGAPLAPSTFSLRESQLPQQANSEDSQT